MIRPYISEINNRQEKQERLQNIDKDDCMPSVLEKKCFYEAYFRSLDRRTKFMATTPETMTCCVLLLRKLLSTKEAWNAQKRSLTVIPVHVAFITELIV